MPDKTDAYPLLDAIENPGDLRKLDIAKLTQVSQELRDFLIHTVSTRGGHFAAGLGTDTLAWKSAPVSIPPAVRFGDLAGFFFS